MIRISREEFKKSIHNSDRYHIIDVAPQEFSQTHAIKNAVNISFGQTDFEQKLKEQLAANKAVVLFCLNGDHDALTSATQVASGLTAKVYYYSGSEQDVILQNKIN